MSVALQTFLRSISALFSIVTPVGGAMMFSQMTRGQSPAERSLLARRVAIYSAIVMLVALWVGSWVLQFFGISLYALRIAGGLVVLSSAWSLLQAPDRHEGREQATQGGSRDDMAFFPLTMPLTTGPGTISVAIALASSTPADPEKRLYAIAGASLAAIAVALMIWVAYALADRMSALLGRSRANIVSRLAAFVLLCVGTQITLAGVADFVRSLSG